jgi:excisionase family DNA binding protein
MSYYNRTSAAISKCPVPGFLKSFLASYLAGETFVAKPQFAQMEVVFDNPPDKHGFTTFTIIRNVGRSGHHYQRHVKLDDLLSSPEAAKILRISVRHLYRLVKEGRIKCKKQKTHLRFVSKDVQRIQLAHRRISGRREPFMVN